MFAPQSPTLPSTPSSAFTSSSNIRSQLTAVGAYDSRDQLLLVDETNDSLAGLYNEILRFLQRDAKGLLDAAAQVRASKIVRVPISNQDLDARRNVKRIGVDKEFSSFDIMSTVIWPEIGSVILEDLGDIIFATGRPDELYNVCAYML